MLRIWELIEYRQYETYTDFMSNRIGYDGIVRIDNDKVANFRAAIKAESLDVDGWNKRVVND